MRMRRTLGVLMALMICLSMPYASAVEGRDAPNCASAELSDVTGAMAVDGGSCLDINLGVHEPGTVLSFDLLVADDAVDVLMFDEAGKAPYELGQSYRSVMTTPVSTEAVLGQQVFHWKVPASINAKAWSMVVDNLAHDGDQGEGDQGGARAQISLQVSVLQDGALTVVHDLQAAVNNTSLWLSGDDGLSLDAGTAVQLEAWGLDGSGDLAFFTDAQRTAWEGGAQHTPEAGTALLDVSSTSSLTWTTPPSLDGVPMHLMLDAGDAIVGGAPPADLRMTVRLTLDPPMNPVIEDDNNGSTTIGQPLLLDASSTPDRLNRLVEWRWDLDADEDVDGDGDATNDGTWGTSTSVSATWGQPGTYTVTLHVRDVDGRTAMVQHEVSVTDVVSPTAAVSSLGDEQPVEDGYRLDPDAVLRLSCTASSDDHRIDVCAWAIDGAPAGQNDTVVASWADSGEHTVRLTVSDPSGNTDVIERRVVVVDRTLPRLAATSVAALPATVDAGASDVVRVTVDDPVDAIETLRVHWDLNPLSDTDGNGVPDDDADLLGEEVQITFDAAGERVVVITVFDPAGNSDRAVWTVDVAAADTTSSSGMTLFAGLGLAVLVVVAVVVFQRRRSSPSEQAPATPEPASEAMQAEEAKAAEMASIYGGNTPDAPVAQAAPATMYAPVAPSAPLDPMAQSLLGEASSPGAHAGMTGLDALMDDEAPEPAQDPPSPEPAPAVEVASEAPSDETPSSTTSSAGGRLELPAGFADMLDGPSDGPQ